MSFAIIGLMNNKFPCNGPRAVPQVFDFSTGSGNASQSVNLAALVQSGQIYDIQSLYIDNADNAASLIVTGGALNQRIKIPPNAQAYLAMLLDQQPVLNFSTTLATGLVVPVYFLNFPVTNAVWKTQ